MVVVELVVPEGGMVVLLAVSAGVTVVELVVPEGVVVVVVVLDGVVVVLVVSVFLLQPASAKTASSASAARAADFFKGSAYMSVSFLKKRKWLNTSRFQCSQSAVLRDTTHTHAPVRFFRLPQRALPCLQ